VVRKFLAWLALEEHKTASPKTGAYCKARARLPLQEIERLNGQILEGLESADATEQHWCGRKVKVVDGSSISMPDTVGNQARYPQPSTQKPGCGFPVMRIVTVFSLGTGVLLDLAKAALKTHERTLFRQLWDTFEVEDVVLGDRGFCSYADFYFLGLRGVDCVMRNHPRRKVGLRQVKRLGKGDRLIHWLKMKPCPKWLSKEQWRAVPDTLLVREIAVTVDVPGFRAKTLVVATTLLDAKGFPKAAIAELYRRRWMAELFLRDIKIALGMDVLRCKTPDMVEKELWMHVIAYNLIRALMCKAARAHDLSPERLSFKGTMATVRQWAPLMAAACGDPVQCEYMVQTLLHYIARDPVPLRPNRTEPRARKRRPKNYQLLNKPRGKFKEIPHRNRYAKP
jgi:hypothetical protein